MNGPQPDPDPTRTAAPPSIAPVTPANLETVSPVPAAEAAGEPAAQFGEYVLLGELGRGGMGAVYRAEDPRLKREVALKVMLPQFATHDQAKARFVREARAQAKVEHDHVAAILHIGDHQGLPYIVMPLLRGLTLHAALRANPRPPLGEVLRIGREIAEGLAAAHEKGLVHRDIKPANVWLEGKKLRVKILDFGLARVADTDGAEGSDGPVTREGAVIGTPAYMSPEQGRGLPVDGRTDLWSLGVVLYQMTTGELPFRGANTLAVLTALALDHPPPPATRNPAVPQHLSDFVMRLLAKEVAYRPRSAEVAAEELRAIELGLVNAVRVVPLDAPPPIILPPDGHDPFADLDATEANSAPEAEPVGAEVANRPAARREPKKSSGGVPMWALVGGVLLAVAGVVAFVATQMGKKPPEPEVAKEEPKPAPRLGTPPKTRDTADPVKRAVAWVLANGGAVAGGTEGGHQNVTSPDAISGPILAVVVPAATVDDAALEHLRPLTDLTNLSLRQAPLTDAGVRALAGMPFAKTLDNLDLSAASLTDAGLDGLAGFPNLHYLGVTGTFTPEGLAKLRKLPKLRRLSSGARRLTDAHLTALKDLPLTDLYLGYDLDLTGAGLANLGQMPSLTTLAYPGENVRDEDLKVFASAMPKLTTLSFATPGTNVPISNKGIAHLRESHVRVLDLAGSQLTPETVTPLPRCEIRAGGKTIAEPTDPHFREASRLLARGGMTVGVQLASGGDEIKAESSAELPDAPFTLTRVSIVGETTVPFSDADLKRLEATPTLVRLELTSAPITDAGFRSVLASKATLNFLYLHGCPLTDRSLATIGELPNIESIATGTWNITDDGVKHLSGLKKLHTAGIGVTPITDACLKHLIGLPLKRLILDDSAISDAGVPTLSKMTGLEELSLKATRVTKAGYEQLKEALPKCSIVWEDPNRAVATMLLTRPDQARLQVTLELPDGKLAVVEKVDGLPKGPFTLVGFYRHGGPSALTDTELRALASIPTLKNLNYPHLVISPTGLCALLPSKNALGSLYLAQCNLTDEHLKVIGELAALTSAHFGATVSGITDDGLAHLAGLPKLESLFLEELAITDAGLKHLANLPALVNLSIGKSSVSDAGIETLAKMKNLRTLDVAGTRVTAAGHERLVRALPNCKVEWEDPNRAVAAWALRAGGAVGVSTPRGFVSVPAGGAIPDGPFSIKGLDLGAIRAVGDAEVRRVAALRDLDTLVLSNTSVTDAGVAHLAALPRLDALYLAGLPLTDDGVRPLKKFSLLKLHLGGTKVTDASIPLLAGFDKLDELNLFETAITDDGLRGLEKLSLLRRLVLVGTKVTEPGAVRLAKALPGCRIEWDRGAVGPGPKP